jgi:hypothetical protein
VPPPGRARRRRRAIPPLAVLAALLCCAPAEATYSAFKLVSAEGAGSSEHRLQADYAYDPAISANGRYVAFVGSLHSQQGVWRKDLETGELALVAPGADTGSPSISETGQYVSFTTADEPSTGKPIGGEPCKNVYVADMGPESQAGAPRPTYTLASAANGSTAKLTYESSTLCGAAAANRVALSGDGQEVAFTTLSPSSLTGPCTPAPAGESCPTPADQVVVRDLETDATTLVSVTPAGQPVPTGAALTATSASTQANVNGQNITLPGSDSTAAISADGSTVAWMGVDVAAQIDLAGQLPDIKYPDGFAEPLWRRIDEGPTLSVLAGRDPSAAGCPPACAGGLDLEWDTQGLQEYSGAAPAYGSYTAEAEDSNGFEDGLYTTPLEAVTPQLSADGETVALLSTQPDYGEDPDFGLFSPTLAPPANAFVVSMAPSLTRAQAIVRLTAWGSLDFKNSALSGSINSIALSPDGSHVAFTTTRTTFPLAPPALITPPVARPTGAQLYEANLQAGTLALVSQGYNGEPASEGVNAAALSEGGRIALDSGAENLVYGVVNGGSDVFYTEEQSSPLLAGVQSVTGSPPANAPTPTWRLSATATPAPGGGALLLDVAVPGRGLLRTSARAAVPVTVRVARAGDGHRARGHSGRGGRTVLRGRADARAAAARSTRHRRSARGKRHSRRAGGQAGLAVLTRQVAQATVASEGPEVIQLRLTPASAYSGLLDRKGGLFATISLTFTAAGQPTLTASLQASFPRPYPLYALPKYMLPKYKAPPKRHKRDSGHGKRHEHPKRGGGQR